MRQFFGNIKTMKIPCVRVGYEGRRGEGEGMNMLIMVNDIWSIVNLCNFNCDKPPNVFNISKTINK